MEKPSTFQRWAFGRLRKQVGVHSGSVKSKGFGFPFRFLALELGIRRLLMRFTGRLSYYHFQHLLSL
jgi:hypothetical protein